MVDEQRLLKLLERIAAALEGSAGETKLGFGEPPMPQYIFIKNEGKYLWYFYNADRDEKIPINEKALTGTITGLKLIEKQFKGEEKTKLDIFVSADQLYALRSGLTTTFSKGLLLALDSLAPQEIKAPLTISLTPGEENTVFCGVYTTSGRIKTEWNPNADWEGIVKKIQKILGYAPSEQQIQSQLEPAEIMKRIEQSMQSLGWSVEDGKRYINDVYKKSSRLQMEPHELLEFMQHLEEVNASRG
ncbi:MAG: hypothetical protein WBB28_27105 [Crinalium sp.]